MDIDSSLGNVENDINKNTIIGIVLVLIIVFFTIKKLSPSFLSNLTLFNTKQKWPEPEPEQEPQPKQKKNRSYFDYY